jgi:DNA-binding IscR family transcriptional regulator
MHQLTDRNTFRIHEILQRVLDQFRQVIRQCLMADVVQIVIVGVLRHPAVKV